MTTPDRWAYLAAQEAWAASQAAPGYGGEQGLPTHQDEVMAKNGCSTVDGATPASGEGHGPWPRPVI